MMDDLDASGKTSIIKCFPLNCEVIAILFSLPWQKHIESNYVN